VDTRSPIVELRGVVKRFGQKTVLPGLDLAVRDGELLTLLTLLEPSGCGKSTIYFYNSSEYLAEEMLKKLTREWTPRRSGHRQTCGSRSSRTGSC